MIDFILIVNKVGQTRLAHYYTSLSIVQRRTLEAELVRKCLNRDATKCPIFAHQGHKIIYRRYVSLYFIIGASLDEPNEFAFYTFIQLFVETLNAYFEKVCELDIVMNVEKVYFVLDEMVQNGQLAEMCQERVLEAVRALDRIKLS